MCKTFYYKNFDFNPQNGELTLSYQMGDKYVFDEKIIFKGAPFLLSQEKKEVLNKIFFLTHIAFGISYYKTFCPENIQIQSGVLTKHQALFFEKFYLEGLGEFAIKNNLNLQGKIHFPFSNTKKTKEYHIDLPRKFLVPIGGGKDSCVTLEFLLKNEKEATPISIGYPRPIKECVEKSGCTHINIARIIDPKLIELNNQGTVYNGHVPITGMLAFILWASAIINDYKYIAMSCENSANTGNLMQGELKINHQYSKSFDFEKDFFNLTHKITPNFLYFSLLRPFKEIKIAKLFAENCEKYFPVFTSCNKAFKLDESKRIDRWCACCDKCRFVFLILAPFINKTTLCQIIGDNPFNNIENLTGYKELLGIDGHKPFECVGEIEECIEAFNLIKNKQEYENDIIISLLKDKVYETKNNNLNQFCENLIPEDIKNALSKFSK